MDLLYFGKILWKRKLPILLLSILAGIGAFMLASEKSVYYKSSAKLATGIIGYIEKPNDGDVYIQEFEITNRFNNLIEMMRSRTSMQLLQSRLILHDITAKEPFHDTKELKKKYTATDLEDLSNVLNTNIDLLRANSRAADTIWTKYEGTIKDVAKLLSYEQEDLQSALRIDRITNTDYLKIEFTGTHVGLPSFAINDFCNDFIAFYTTIVNRSTNESIDFLRSMSGAKKAELDAKLEALKQFKLRNEVADVDEQNKTTMTQISNLEIAREEARKKIPAYEKTLKKYDGYSTQNLQTFDQIQRDNRRITELRDAITRLNNENIASGGKNANIRKQIDNLREQLDVEIHNVVVSKGTGKTPDPRDVIMKGENLWEKKIDAEVELELSKQSVNNIDREIGRLRGQMSHLVEKEATISALDREIAMLSDEYLNLSDKLNVAEMNAKGNRQNAPLQVIEIARPADKPEPSQRGILAGFAAFVMFTIGTLFVLVAAYMDNSLSSTLQYNKLLKKLPLVQHLNAVNMKNFDLERLFQENTNNKSQETFKQLLRNLRFEVENVGAKKWLIASTKQREGKTFTAVGLAYSLCLNNKKVLLIDTNFKNNTLSKLPINTTTEYAHILQTTIQRYGLQNAFQTGGNLFENDGAMVDVVSCRSNNLSVSEILAGKDFRAFVDELATKYDYLFFEGPALNDFTDTKEIVNYADKVLMVVSAKSKVYSSDQFSINYLQQINGKLKGAVLNQIELKNI
jgi:Mrp family chromosome partitioning ATPase/uncharacterized protein involved in exopolysaccharide biosynthesis